MHTSNKVKLCRFDEHKDLGKFSFGFNSNSLSSDENGLHRMHCLRTPVDEMSTTMADYRLLHSC